MITVYIVVLDYTNGCVKTYTHDFKKGYQVEDVELWLGEKTDYKDDQCYYMCSTNPIDIIEGEVEED